MLDNEQDSEDLATAAVRLGLTPETIRKRLQRGKLKGYKAADGTWRVNLDRVDSKQDNLGQTAGQEQDKAGQGSKAIIELLTDQVQFLRKQLEVRDEEFRRVHVLWLQEKQSIKEITNQIKEEVSTNESINKNSRLHSLIRKYDSLQPVENALISLFGYTIAGLGAAWASLTNDDKYDISVIIINEIDTLVFYVVLFIALRIFREFWSRSHKYSEKLFDVVILHAVVIAWILSASFGIVHYVVKVPSIFPKIIEAMQANKSLSPQETLTQDPPATQADKPEPSNAPPDYH